MKAAVIFYHKNIEDIYDARWIRKCVDSIADQTYGDFDVFELDYAGGDTVHAKIPGRGHVFFSEELPNHTYAMNFLLDELFTNRGYDVVFNTNMDDYFHPTRFAKQIECIEQGYDLVSSDFCYIEERGNDDVITLHLDICQYGDIVENINKKHNMIAHPCVAYSKTFWTDGLRYENLLGYEDLSLWKRAVDAGKKLHIINEELLYYRIHQKQVTKKYKAI